MKYLSVCSGIEAASVAWKPLGWECVGVAEIEKFPSAVLAHHYPNVPNLGDLTKYQEWPRDLAPDLIVGGTPCQSFSVAGLRAGLADPRGNLALVFLGLVDQYRPRYVVWENVPGVRSSGGGRDFGAFLGALGELGYGWAYRSLDAQYFSLAQRRERVFVVGCLGDWRASAAVLLEPEGLRGHPAPRREAGQGLAGTTAPSLTASGRGTERAGDSRGQDPVIAFAPEVGNTLTARMHKGINTTCDEGQTMVTHSLRGAGFDASEDGTGRGTPLVPMSVALRGREGGATAELGDEVAFALRATSGGGDKPHVLSPIAFSAKDRGADAGEVSPTLRAVSHAGSHPNAGGQVAVAFAIQERAICENPDAGPDGVGVKADGTAYTLEARTVPQAVAFANSAGDTALGYSVEHVPPIARRNGDPGNVATASMAVRRLTPRECERLQGFPDDYTLIPYRNGMSADGPRYKALGNSMAVPVMAWIGRRIAAVDALLVELQRQEAA